MPNDKEKPGAGFDAFISYSREDVTFASKLEFALRAYRPPKDLDVPQRNLRVFRDETSMVGTELSQAIEDNIRNSNKLIVVCSPSARKRPWVDAEIRKWIELKDSKDIIPVLLKGKPNNDATDEEEDLKAFPKALYEDTYVKEEKIPLATPYVGLIPQAKKSKKEDLKGHGICCWRISMGLNVKRLNKRIGARKLGSGTS